MRHDMKAEVLVLIAASLALCSCGSTAYVAESSGEEVYNIGYGTVQAKDNAFAVSKVEVNEDEIGTYADIFEYLRGRVSGLVIGYASAGEMPSMQIRGVNSINASSEPLIIVDGIVTDNITYLNPSDVGAIDVLKDASAGIYGARGANGVILITTRGFMEARKQEAEMKKAARAEAKAAKKRK